MLRKLLVAAILLSGITGYAQYRGDNVLFTTVDPADLCNMLEKNKGYLLLDVRSKGEHYDTSSSAGLNLGHLKGAKNINITDLGTRLNEIRDFKDQPVFIYCSHSQRSRRASKMLADSGFTKVFNINGGLSAFYYTDARAKDCLPSLVESNNKYSIISANELAGKMLKDNPPYLLDVRSDSAFRHISTDAKTNALGTIQGAVNIPLSELNQLPNKLSSFPRETEIIIMDLYGGDAAKAAVMLTNNGYTNVSMLVEGVDRLLYSLNSFVSTVYKSPVAFGLLNNKDFGKFAADHPDMLLLDVRTTDEFNNKFKDSWRNIGHMKNAVNIPSTEINNRIAEIEKYKNKDVIIYSFSNSPESFTAATALQQQGFKKIKILIGGVFNLRWTAANVKGYSTLKDWVVDVPEVNW